MNKTFKEISTSPKNKTPLIYSHFDYTKRVELREKLEHIFNELGIDNVMGIQDFVLAEMVDNFICVTYNTKKAMEDLGYNNIVDNENTDEYKIEQCEQKFKAGDKVLADGKVYTIKLVNEDNYIVDENGRDVQEHFSYTKDWKLYEQNPTDNIEPKFNVGDIISDSISEVEIVSIDKENKYYNVINGEIENDANICNWVIYFKDQEKWKLVKYKSYNKENKEHPQLKKEWSEDDEYYYGIIQYILNNECVGKTDRECAINWFKHFKDIIQLQNRVKPSERQISALEWQLKNTYEGSWQYIETKKLFEQLKRLMEK